MKGAAVDDFDSVQNELAMSLLPLINTLHNKVLETRRLRAERLVVRRQQDIQDELDVCKGQSSLEADNLFEDVVDEYASLSIIKSHLEKWKFQHSSYQQAYVSLCLPKLFTPFVKLQLVTWNPLEVKAKELDGLRC
ncbi:PAX3- and PAX7-binding protein 1-like [Dysidea avara]|uniref:PAX3- and PAX7-binding protein 1-like n=1 Tax=Dysidea avara TaxID=196820 RepID=UPI00332EBC91